MSCLSIVLLFWTILGFVNPKFIRFKESFEYVYELKTDVDFLDIGKFQIAAKISYTVIESVPTYQEILLKVYGFHFKRSEDTSVTGNDMDLSKWFSFQIKTNGEILRVFHPPEDDEVLATKKGLAALLAAKLHGKDETLIYHKELGILHKVMIEDSFTSMTVHSGFMPNQPGFWPYWDNFYGPPSGVATAPPLAPAPPVAVSLTPAVAPSAPVPASRAQSSSSSHGTQGSDSAPSLDGFQKILLDFVESFKAEFSTLSSRISLLENRLSSHQPSPAKSVEYDELSVSPGSQERAFLTDEDDDSSSSPKISKTTPEPSSKSARQPATKETGDPPSSLKDPKDKVYTLMRDEAHIPFASPPKPKRLSSTFEASCGISQDSVTSHNSFPESGHMAFALQIINESIANSASEKVANNQISGFGMSSFSDHFKYKDFDIFDSSLGRLVPTCDKSLSSLLGIKPVDGLRLTQPVWAKTENLFVVLLKFLAQPNIF
ncbi:unnamed protein product [Mytilus coruscus]|uniref:Uncharacterized protein n=1 Tax=Mytilus coruscus TaxID=42192 RepID=A0A6J8EZ59_MYTCO|nr:unnamed protein product [Mytilus coruscus]